MQLGLIGNGSWATALAKILTDNGHVVHWWMRNEQSAQYILSKNHNPDYLSSVYFKNESVIPTSNIAEVINSNEIIIFCTPSAFILDVLNQLTYHQLQNKVVVSAIKGLILGENVLLNVFLSRQFDFNEDNYVSITGPCHAEEVAQERLSYLTFSSNHKDLAAKVSALFEGAHLHAVLNTDIYGSQYAAVLKNIYAVGAGIAHGLGYGDNFLSVYVTNCYNEMHKFLIYQFGHSTNQEIPEFNTSAYLGDLLVTCYSNHSRNRTFGSLVGKGYFVKSASSEMNMVAEGYYAVSGMYAIIQKIKFEMPIVESIYQVLKGGHAAQEVFSELEKMFK